MKKNILLVNPNYRKETRWATDDQAHAQMLHDMVPLGLATVAALTPDEYHVDIWDEPVRGKITPQTRFEREYDLVGLTGYRSHLNRCEALSELFRGRGIPVVVGGPGVSGTPDRCRGLYDVLFIGEAEKTWPQFLEDWQRGCQRSEYRQIEKPDLADSPIPKWDSIAADFPKYGMGCVQTTRGCPFDCEFCDVIYLFGRRQRHKPIDRVLEEIRVLERLGIRSIYFSDDEFIGDPAYAAALLRALIPLNNSFDRPLTYSTQLTMNLSRSEELLELFADANFYLVFLGVETPNKKSLKETGKFQNLRADLVGDVHKILSYGIAVRSGTIVGFDNDDKDIFDMQYNFIQECCVPSVSLHMLTAAIGTRLWRRLRQEGRLIDISKSVGQRLLRVYTNIVPKKMTRLELMRGFRVLVERVYDWQSFGERMEGWVSLVRRIPNVPEEPVSPEEMARLGDTLKLEPQNRRIVQRIMEHTQRVCPYLLRRVKELVVQHAMYCESVRVFLSEMDAQIELEASGQVSLEPDNRPLPIPAAFRAAYRQTFLHVYPRVHLNLDDKDQAPAVLTEIFVDFLVRWGEQFERLEDYHLSLLNELADRTCARFNGQPPQDFRPVTQGQVPLREVKRRRLADDVIQSVEQELVRIELAQPA